MKVSLKSELDLSGLTDLKKRLKKLDKKQLEWGFLEGNHSQADMSYAALAGILEWGARSSKGGWAIPPRPAFTNLVNSLESSHKAYELAVQKLYTEFVLGQTKSPDRILKASGEHITSRHENTMEYWIVGGSQYTSNAPLTVELKGFDQPFMDTGELVQNITYKVI